MSESTLSLPILLQDVMARNGSDLHLIPNMQPIVRVAGEIGALPFPAIGSDAIMKLLDPYLTPHHRETYKNEMRANFSYTINGLGRFRISVCQTLGMVSAAIRVIPTKVYPLAILGLPPIVSNLASKRAGIIFITGATGNGKSTTMAALLEQVNQSGRPSKIMTVEDPIETIFKPVHSIFVQRELGVDTLSFDAGIIDALRHDPDILCVGEMRSPASIQAALLAAETGHLVLTTLHTRDASKTAQRLVAGFPQADQEGVREQLAATLEAVISQRLLPRADGKGLILAVEVLTTTPAVRQLIRDDKFEAINDAIQVGTKDGMISIDSWIKNLYQKMLITRETALENMRHPELLPK